MLWGVIARDSNVPEGVRLSTVKRMLSLKGSGANKFQFCHCAVALMYMFVIG